MLLRHPSSFPFPYPRWLGLVLCPFLKRPVIAWPWITLYEGWGNTSCDCFNYGYTTTRLPRGMQRDGVHLVRNSLATMHASEQRTHAHIFLVGPATCVHKDRSVDATPKSDGLAGPMLSPKIVHRNARLKEPHENTPMSERMNSRAHILTQGGEPSC